MAKPRAAYHASGSGSDGQHDLAELRSLLEVVVGGDDLIEAVHPVDDGRQHAAGEPSADKAAIRRTTTGSSACSKLM